MSEPFLGEIRIFAGNFAPKDWALCNGQLMAIAQNTALFSLLGTAYGGDGRVTFGLPSFQGAAPVSQGQGPALSPYALGETGGTPTVTLLSSEVPPHLHPFNAGAPGRVNSNVATANVPGGLDANTPLFASGQANTTMSPQTIAPLQGGLPHENRQPYLCLTFIIALQGIFPQRP
jgi:microcystin-dependent protein